MEFEGYCVKCRTTLSNEKAQTNSPKKLPERRDAKDRF